MIVRSRFLARLAVCVLGSCAVLAACSPEPDTAHVARDGVVVMAHGGNPQWNADVEQAVAPLRQTYPVEIAYGMADAATLRAAVRNLETRGVERIAVVRLFISGESFLPETEYILGKRSELPERVRPAVAGHGHQHGHGGADAGHRMAAPEPIDTKVEILISGPGIQESPLVDAILAERITALSTDPGRESVMVLGHGPADDAENARWLAFMEQRVSAACADRPYRTVECFTLREDWPEKRADAERRIREFAAQATEDGGRLIVVPFRVAGFGPYRTVLEGYEYAADGRGFCPHENVTRWLAETAERTLASPRMAVAEETPSP